MFIDLVSRKGGSIRGRVRGELLGRGGSSFFYSGCGCHDNAIQKIKMIKVIQTSDAAYDTQKIQLGSLKMDRIHTKFL